MRSSKVEETIRSDFFWEGDSCRSSRLDVGSLSIEEARMAKQAESPRFRRVWFKSSAVELACELNRGGGLRCSFAPSQGRVTLHFPNRAIA